MRNQRDNQVMFVASLSLALIVVSLFTAGCGAPTPTPTSTPTPAPTPTPTPSPEPTPTFDPTVPALEWTPLSELLAPAPVPADPSVPVVYEVERLQLPGGYQFRLTASIPAWGFNLGDQIDGTVGDGILLTVNVGDTLNIERVTNPARLSAETHSVVNEELGINITLAPDEEVSLSITFDKAGTFVLDDPAKPGALGKFVIVVEEAPAAGPRVYEVERLQLPGGYQFRLTASIPAWGFNLGDQIDGTVGDGILLTVNVGDTLNIERVTNPARLSAETHSVVNEELGINITLAPDEEVSLSITFDKAGTFVLDDPAKPGALGKFVIVVEE